MVMAMDLLVAILYLLSFLLIWQFVGYPTFMAFIAIRSKLKNIDRSYTPFVSILVPTYNEQNVIKNRIENLLSLDYPKDGYEIIIVDSGSSDETVQIASSIIAENDNKEPAIRLLREEKRNGKGSAINFGKKYSKGNIILVTDANSIFDHNVLKVLMPHFKDPKVGAVGGRYVVLNPDNHITSSTQFYWEIEYIMRRGESILDSACLFHGEINAWRKELVDADPTMLSEDLDMCISIRKKGYKIVYDENAIVYEPAANTVEEQIKQRKRTSIGTIQNMFKHWKYFVIPRNWYSLLIFPSHKALVMFSPFLLILIPIIYIISFNIYLILTHSIITLFAFGSLLAMLMYLKSKLKSSKGEGNYWILSIPKIIFYVLLNEYLIVLAWMDFILKKYSVKWAKVESTRSI
jgi:cellulose synthase/poly-beta-1,6-N-acetylglucosamine synthase-like glycosyltransferase